MAAKDLDPVQRGREGEEVKDLAEEKEIVRERRKSRLGWVIPSVSLATAFYLGQLAKDRGFDVTDIIKLTRQENIPVRTSELKAPETTEEQINLIDKFFSFKAQFENAFTRRFSFEGMRLSDNKASADFVNNQAREFLVDGVYLAKLVLPANEANDIYETREGVFIDGERYDPNNSFERSLASAILEFKFKRVRTNFDAERELKQERDFEQRLKQVRAFDEYYEASFQRRYKEIEDRRTKRLYEVEESLQLLPWLKRKGLNITVELDAWAILDTEYILVMAKTLKTAEEHNLPLHLGTRFVKHTKAMRNKDGDFGGWYEGHDRKNPFTIVVTNAGSAYSFPHEYGHFISNAEYLKGWEERMAPFSQEAFTREVWGKDEDPQSRKAKEMYAEAVKDYLFFGERSRLGTTRIYDVDSLTTNEKQKVYDFIKRMWRAEFREFAQVIIFKKDYEPGLLVRINDPDTINPGFLLRLESSTPGWALTSELPAVFNRDIVLLLERRAVNRFDGRGEREMWKVQVRGQHSDSIRRVGEIVGVEGWIDAGALGTHYEGR